MNFTISKTIYLNDDCVDFLLEVKRAGTQGLRVQEDLSTVADLEAKELVYVEAQGTTKSSSVFLTPSGLALCEQALRRKDERELMRVLKTAASRGIIEMRASPTEGEIVFRFVKQ